MHPKWIKSIFVIAWLAQVETVAGWPGILTQGGSFAVVVFVVWWLLTKTIPGIIKSNAEALESQQKTFAHALELLVADSKADRDAFKASSEAERRTFANEIHQRNTEILRRDEQLINALKNQLDKRIPSPQ